MAEELTESFYKPKSPLRSPRLTLSPRIQRQLKLERSERSEQEAKSPRLRSPRPPRFIDAETVDLLPYLIKERQGEQQLVGWGAEGHVYQAGKGLVVKVFWNDPIPLDDLMIREDPRTRHALQVLEDTYGKRIGYEELFAYIVGQAGLGPRVWRLQYNSSNRDTAMLMDQWQYTFYDFMNNRGNAKLVERDEASVIEHAVKAIEAVVNVNALGINHKDLRSTNIMFEWESSQGHPTQQLKAGLIDFQGASLMRPGRFQLPIKISNIDSFLAEGLMHDPGFAKPSSQSYLSEYRRLVGEFLWELPKTWRYNQTVLFSRSNLENMVKIIGPLLIDASSKS